METDGGKNLRWHPASITVDERREMLGFGSCVLWFTGLPSSGKSTIANALCRRLHSMGVLSFVLDGDNVRHGLNRDLGFSPDDRKENIRRVAEVSRLLVDAGVIVLAAFVSPAREDRLQARRRLQDGDFIEVFVQCGVEECERRDPKGMYRQARAGRIKEFTGISAPYEAPETAELVLDSDRTPVDACVDRLIDYLAGNGKIRRPDAPRSDS